MATTRALYVATGYHKPARVAEDLNRVAAPAPQRFVFDVTDSNQNAVERLSRVNYQVAFIAGGKDAESSGLGGNTTARLVRAMLGGRGKDLVLVLLLDDRQGSATKNSQPAAIAVVDWEAVDFVLLTPWADKTLLRLLHGIKTDAKRRLRRVLEEALAVSQPLPAMQPLHQQWPRMPPPPPPPPPSAGQPQQPPRHGSVWEQHQQEGEEEDRRAQRQPSRPSPPQQQQQQQQREQQQQQQQQQQGKQRLNQQERHSVWHAGAQSGQVLPEALQTPPPALPGPPAPPEGPVYPQQGDDLPGAGVGFPSQPPPLPLPLPGPAVAAVASASSPQNCLLEQPQLPSAAWPPLWWNSPPSQQPQQLPLPGGLLGPVSGPASLELAPMSGSDNNGSGGLGLTNDVACWGEAFDVGAGSSGAEQLSLDAGSGAALSLGGPALPGTEPSR